MTSQETTENKSAALLQLTLVARTAASFNFDETERLHGVDAAKRNLRQIMSSLKDALMRVEQLSAVANSLPLEQAPKVPAHVAGEASVALELLPDETPLQALTRGVRIGAFSRIELRDFYVPKPGTHEYNGLSEYRKGYASGIAIAQDEGIRVTPPRVDELFPSIATFEQWHIENYYKSRANNERISRESRNSKSYELLRDHVAEKLKGF